MNDCVNRIGRREGRVAGGISIGFFTQMDDKEHEEAVHEWIKETVADEEQVPLDNLVSSFLFKSL